MKKSKKLVHFTFMPGEIASELCGNAQPDDRITGTLGRVTCMECLDKVQDMASHEPQRRKNLVHTIDTLGWVVDTLKAHHMSRRGIPEIIKEVDKRMATVAH